MSSTRPARGPTQRQLPRAIIHNRTPAADATTYHTGHSAEPPRLRMVKCSSHPYPHT